MFVSTAPALVGIILLLLVAGLTLVAERGSPESRWFVLFNLLLACTSALGSASTSVPEGQAARALLYGRMANGATALALLAFDLHLSSLARATPHESVQRLRRFTSLIGLVTVVVGGASSMSSQFVSGVTWIDGVGYRPTFGAAVPLVFVAALVIGGWAVALLVVLFRHGSTRRRVEAAWIGAGVVLFDLFGLVLLAIALPHFEISTAQWAPTSAAAGSVVMLGAMVLTRQRELERLASSPSSSRRISPHTEGSSAPGCRACATCSAILGSRVEMRHCPLDGGEFVTGVDPWPGRVLDQRIALEELLGVGGMGRVYRARHLHLGTALAVKLLNAELAADARTVERFAREARSAMRIRSPHVVIVHDLGELPPGIPFLTMELIDGAPLSRLFAGGSRLTPASVAQLGTQLADGLAAAHAEGVIHRDLKPDNVLIADDGERQTAKIVDFGLAKIVDEVRETELTTLGRVFGTPTYLSPEQAAGRPADARSDVYTLGVILYRARAGRTPFRGSHAELVAQHILATPRPLGDAPLDRLIMSLLDKDPARRPDAQSLAVALAALGDGNPQLVMEKGAFEPPTTEGDSTVPDDS